MARVLFIQDTLCEFAGVATLSAVLKRAGHTTALEVVEGKTGRARLPALLASHDPDLVAFSSVSIGLDRRLALARICRQQGYLVTMGGPHPTFHPEMVSNPDVDLFCSGEGEGAIVDIADRIDAGWHRLSDFSGIANLSYQDEDGPHRQDMRQLVDIDDLPPIDRDLYYDRFPAMANFSNKRVHVSRGCPHSCTFCDAVTLRRAVKGLGKFVRYRDPDSIIDEIDVLRRRWGFRTLTLTAETFTAHKRWALSFLEAYATKVRVPFVTAAVYSELDEDVVKALADAGCHCLTLGLESGNERIRAELLGKEFSNELILEKGALLKKYGIRVMSFCMFGAPTETVDEAWETVDMEVKIGAVAHSPTLLQPYRGTPILEYIEQEGLLREGVTEHDIFHKAIGIAVDTPDRDRIENLQKLSWLVLKEPKLRPVVKKLIELPPNPAFSAVMLAGLLQKYTSSRQVGAVEFSRLAVHMRHDYKSFFW